MLKKIMHTCTRKNKKILFTHVKAAENTSPYHDHDDYDYDNKIILLEQPSKTRTSNTTEIVNRK